MVAVLMMSTKLATLGLLKINLFWNKGYYVIISVHDVTSKSLLWDSNYIADVVMWPKFGISSLSMKEVKPQFYKDVTRKAHFFEGWSWFTFNYLGVALGMALKFYISMAKGLKLKVKKV